MEHLDDNNPPALNHTKGSRGPARSSCAECKRLKVRCSGTTEPFPCRSCVKRGISVICPNGVANGRKGDAGDSDVLTRHIQEQNVRIKELNAQVKELQRELEKAKGAIVSPAASGSDRRTDDDEMTDKNENDENSLVEAFGTLTVEGASGRTTWHGPYTPTINLLPVEDHEGGDLASEHLYDESLPPELAVLAAAFPFTKTTKTTGLKDIIRALTPSYDEVVGLTESFYSRASWLGSPCSQERFMIETVMPLYASKSWELERADQIALFFSVVSVGAMFDPNRPQYDPLAFRLHKLCAVSLALAKPLDTPTVTALEALQYHLLFHQLSDTPLAIARYWNLTATAFRMAQALGLHRDSRAWALEPAHEERRRLLFWQLNFMDAVGAAASGRPRYFNPRHYDCPIPKESFREDLKGLITWRYTFLRDAFIPVLEDGFAVHPPPTYATIIGLDRKVRDVPLLKPNTPHLDVIMMTTAECLQLFCVGGMKELALLYLHRRFLFEAVSDDQCADISTHKYAYSVNAGLHAAAAMTRQTRGLFQKDSNLCSRIFFIWQHGFSALYVLCHASRIYSNVNPSSVFAATVIKRPGSEHAEMAMKEMDSLLAVFSQAQSSRRARRCLPTMVSLREKAFAILSLHHAGQNFKPLLDGQLEKLIGGTSLVLRPSTQDKLEFDLQALFGFGNESNLDMNDRFAQTTPIPQPGDSEPPQWNAPLNAQNAEEMSEIDQLLFGYVNDQSGILNLDTPNWEALM